jgi:hypothetical protein
VNRLAALTLRQLAGHASKSLAAASLRLRLLAVGLALAGCQRETPPAVTLRALDVGDRACYVVVAADGGTQSLEGDFDLCPGGAQEASALIGQRVLLTQRKERVQAASCQGDPECDRFDEVDLVVAISPAPF